MPRFYIKILETLEHWAKKAGVNEEDWQSAVFEDLTEGGNKLFIVKINQDRSYDTDQIALCGNRVFCKAVQDNERCDTLFIYQIYSADKELPPCEPVVLDGTYTLIPRTMKPSKQLDSVSSFIDFFHEQEVETHTQDEENYLPSPQLIKILSKANESLRSSWRPGVGPVGELNPDSYFQKVRYIWSRFRLDAFSEATLRQKGLLGGIVRPAHFNFGDQRDLLKVFNFSLLNLLSKEQPTSTLQLLEEIVDLPVSDRYRASIWSNMLLGLDPEGLARELQKASSCLLSLQNETSNSCAPIIIKNLQVAAKNNNDSRLQQVLDSAEVASFPLRELAEWASRLLFSDDGDRSDDVVSSDVAGKGEPKDLQEESDLISDKVVTKMGRYDESLIKKWVLNLRVPDSDLLGRISKVVSDRAETLKALADDLHDFDNVRALCLNIETTKEALDKCFSELPDPDLMLEDLDDSRVIFEKTFPIFGENISILLDKRVSPSELEEIAEIYTDKTLLDSIPSWLWTWGGEDVVIDLDPSKLDTFFDYLCMPLIRKNVGLVKRIVGDENIDGLKVVAGLKQPGTEIRLEKYLERAIEQLRETKDALREIDEDQQTWISESIKNGSDLQRVLRLAGKIEEIREEISFDTYGMFLAELSESVSISETEQQYEVFYNSIKEFVSIFGSAKDATFQQLKKLAGKVLLTSTTKVDENIKVVLENNYVDSSGRRVPIYYIPYDDPERPYGFLMVPILLISDNPFDAEIDLNLSVKTDHRSAWPSYWENPTPEKFKLEKIYWRIDGKKYVYSVKIKIPIKDPSKVKGTAFEFELQAFNGGTNRSISPLKRFRWDMISSWPGPVALDWPDGGVRTEWVENNPVGPQKCVGQIMGRVQSCSSFAIVAPRRFGKTTLVEYVRQQALEAGFVVPPQILCTSDFDGSNMDYDSIWQQLSDHLQKDIGASIVRDWQGGLPSPGAFDFVRKAAKDRGKKGVLLLFDEAQLLFSRQESKGHSLGDRFKDRLETEWCKSANDKVNVFFGFVGLPGLTTRAGVNLMGAIRPMEHDQEFDEKDLLSLVRIFTEGRLHLTRESRQRLSEKSVNLLVLKTFLEKLISNINDEQRNWAFFEDCVKVEEELKAELSAGRGVLSPISAHIRDAFNDAESVNNWRPKSCYPFAVALEKVIRGGAKDSADVLSKSGTLLNGWCKTMQPDGAKRLVYTKERLDEHLQTLREMGLFGEVGFKSELLASWLSGRSKGFPHDEEDKKSLFKGAMERIRIPQSLEPVVEGSQASIFRFSNEGIIYALRKVKLSGQQERDRFLESADTLTLLRDKVDNREEGAEYVFHLKEIGLADDDDNVGVEIYRWVSGIPLQKKIGELEAPLVANLALKLSKALSLLHRNGILHRDINPRNIVLSEEGANPVLIDFGLARLAGKESSTPLPSDTAAPEVRGSNPKWSKAADVYSLGRSLHLILDEGSREPLLQKFIERCTVQDPHRRPAADDLVGLLENIVMELQVKKLGSDLWDSVIIHAKQDLGKKWFSSVLNKFRPRIEAIGLGLHHLKFDQCAEVASFLDQVLEASSRKSKLGSLKNAPEVQLGRSEFQAIDFLHRLRIERNHVDPRKGREAILSKLGFPDDNQLLNMVRCGADEIGKFVAVPSLSPIVCGILNYKGSSNGPVKKIV